MVDSWHLQLDSLNAVATDESYLCVLTTLLLRLAQFETDKPFNLRLDLWVVMRVQSYILNVQTPQSEASCVSACVYSLYLLE